MIGALYNKIKSALSGLVDKAMSALGINSPSRVFRDKVGKFIPAGIAAGIEANMDEPIKTMEEINAGMIDAAGGLGGIQFERQLNQTATQNVAAASPASGLSEKLDRILASIERGQVLTIDGAALVGATADRYDATLGKRRALAARGAV